MPEDQQDSRPDEHSRSRRPAQRRQRPAPGRRGQTPRQPAGGGAGGKGVGSVAARAGVGDKAGSGAKSALKDIAQGAAKGAAGKSAEGKLAGGGLTGAVAGAAREAVHHANWKWVVAVLCVAMLPTFLLISGVVVVGSLIGGISANTGESSAQSVSSSTGVSAADLALYQTATASNETPWQVLAAVAYYESGLGEPVAQTVGICPPASGASASALDEAGSAVCPAIGQGLSSGGGGLGTATTQTVPLGVVAKDSPDRTTTDTTDWACIRTAESGGDYQAPGGAYGISEATWQGLGGRGTPASAPAAEQDRFALKLFAQNGYRFNYVWHDSCTEPAVTTAELARYDDFGLVPGKTYPGSTLAVPTTEAGAAYWVATRITDSLEKSGGWTSSASYSLTDAVSVPDGGVPRVSLSSYPAFETRKTLLAALATLPIRANSSRLDLNVYELALDWTVGVSPAVVTPIETGCAVASGSTLIIPNGGGGQEILDAEQLSNAATIVAVGRQLGIPTLGIYVAIDTALTESSLENLPNATVPGSESDPNVEWGPYSPQNPPDNGTSVGLFQQQDNWGSVTQRMDQAWSAAAFYGTFADWTEPVPHPGGLVAVAGWQSMNIATAAQAVQGSADPTRYLGFIAGAQATVDYLSGTPCAAGVLTSTTGATSQGAAAIRAAERWIGTPYVWGGGDPQGPTLGLSGAGAQDQPPNLEGQPGFDCSGLVQYAYAQAGVALPRTSQTQATFVQSLGGWTTNISQLVPGDLVFFAGSDGTIQSPGHVGIYLGNDQMIQAPETGEVVDIVAISNGAGFAGGGPVT